MSTATAAPPKTSLDNTQREWLKQMGAALDVKVGGAPGAAPAVGAAAKDGQAAPQPAVDPVSVAGKPIIKIGSKGQDVKDAQTLLINHGATLKVDGDFGKLTDAATKEFQKNHPPLKADGVIGPQTWTALATPKLQPPTPEVDTKPRRVIFIVTDGANNDAVKNAVVTLGNVSEKTGNTGQATLSIPPGSYPFGVAADGFEQSIGTFEVSPSLPIDGNEQAANTLAAPAKVLAAPAPAPTKDAPPAKDKPATTEKRVELQRNAAPTSKTELSVTPFRETLVNQQVVLTATVTMLDGSAVPPGTVLFETTLSGSPRQILKEVDVKNGKAELAHDLLVKGQHTLDATFVPKPSSANHSKSQAKSVAHTVLEKFDRNTNVDTDGQKKRQDKLPIATAKTKDDVTKTVEDKDGQKGHTAAQLDKFSKIMPNVTPPAGEVKPVVPTAAETNQIRETYAKLNTALSDGNAEDAAKLSGLLGLPISEKELTSKTSTLTDVQWKTACAMGLVKFIENPNGSLAWVIPKVPNKASSALNGNAGYSQLADDMAAKGVKPLSAPPDQEQMRTYMEHVRSEAERDAKKAHPNDPDKQKTAVSDALLDANRRLMDGMQVHYRGVQGPNPVDPEFGPNKTWPTFIIQKGKLVVGADGKPVSEFIAFDDPQRDAKIKKFLKAHGGGKDFTCKTKTPEGMADNTDRGVFGNRHESDCEGMASFRLRTLPPDCKALGVVSGRLKADPNGIGHAVALYQSPDGRVLLSSNGKPVTEVKPSGKTVTGDNIRLAVADEFLAIYKNANPKPTSDADFFFGIGKSKPPADSSLNAINASVDQVMQDASIDDILRHDASTRKSMPPLDWNQLAP